MNDKFTNENIALMVISEIKRFVLNSKDNIFREIGGHYFDEPIVQFASANNPFFAKYKEIIGEYHLTPKEILETTFSERTDQYGTVISVVLPINATARRSNRAENEFGSKEWTLTRYYGDELFIDKLVEHVISYLKSNGYWGIAPSKSNFFQRKKLGRDISSNWSERHIAYAAGLGTFSINDGFITEKGIAVKLVSILTDANIPQSEQVYHQYQQNCLWCSKGICGSCMKRCPVGAITEKGHDKIKCYMHCYGERSKEVAKKYGGSSEYGSGCGLCQTGVPCEFSNPLKFPK
jgi:ferredoxin